MRKLSIMTVLMVIACSFAGHTGNAAQPLSGSQMDDFYVPQQVGAPAGCQSSLAQLQSDIDLIKQFVLTQRAALGVAEGINPALAQEAQFRMFQALVARIDAVGKKKPQTTAAYLRSWAWHGAKMTGGILSFVGSSYLTACLTLILAKELGKQTPGVNLLFDPEYSPLNVFTDVLTTTVSIFDRAKDIVLVEGGFLDRYLKSWFI
jgi:hypothetical protein